MTVSMGKSWALTYLGTGSSRAPTTADQIQTIILKDILLKVRDIQLKSVVQKI